MYEEDKTKLNIPDNLKLKGELRKEFAQDREDLGKLDTTELEKLLKQRKQAKAAKREALAEDRHGEVVSRLSKMIDGMRELYKKDVVFPQVQKVAGEVTAKVANFPAIQKVTGNVVSKITNWPDVFKVEGNVKTEVTNWPQEKEIEFPDVQKVEVQNQPDKIQITNLPVGRGEEAGKGARPDEYVPVRLTNGRSFYNAVQAALSSAGSLLPFRDSLGKPVQARVDDYGRVISSYAPIETLITGNISNTDGASTEIIAAQGAGSRTAITDITITNTSGSFVYVEVKDGATAKYTLPVPAGGGVTHSFGNPIVGSANTAWNVDPSAAASTIYCSVNAFVIS